MLARESAIPVTISMVIDSLGCKETVCRIATTGSRTDPAVSESPANESKACGDASVRRLPMNRMRSVS